MFINTGFKQIRKVSSSFRPTGRVAVLPNGSFGNRMAVLCNPERVHVYSGLNHEVFSAGVLDISSFDEYMKKTSDVDVAAVSAFTGGVPNEEPARGEWFDKKSQDTEALRAKISASPFGYVEVDGEYYSGDYRNSEIFFILTNANSGQSTEAFFEFVAGLGEAFCQESVLLKPAKDIQFRGKPLAREIAYRYYTDGTKKWEEKGRLRKATYEQWLNLSDKLSDGVGGSRLDAEADLIRYAGSSFRVTGMDFSRLVSLALLAKPGTSHHAGSTYISLR